MQIKNKPSMTTADAILPGAPTNHVSEKSKRPSLAKRIALRLSAGLVLMTTTVILLEICLRLLPLVLQEPQKSMLEEAARIPLSNTRTFYSVKILLPPAEKKDVVVIGDSFTFGVYVSGDNTFSTLLGEKTGKKVVNLGIGSQGPPEYNRMLEVGARYQPTHVFYCIFANDFLLGEFPESLYDLSSEHTFSHLPMDDALFFESLGSHEKVYALRKKVSNQFLSLQLYKLFDQPIQDGKMSKVEWRKDDLYYSFVTKEYWNERLSIEQPAVQKSLAQITDLAAAAAAFCDEELGATFTVVLLPSKEMTHAPSTSPEVQAKIYDYLQHETYQALSRELAASNIPCVDLTPAYRKAAAEGEKLYFSIDGHFNEAGHELAAELLKQLLEGTEITHQQ